MLTDVVKPPVIPEGFGSSWAQYTIQLPSQENRNALQAALKEHGISAMVYYPTPMHLQTAFNALRDENATQCPVATRLSHTVLSLPMHPYLSDDEITAISLALKSSLA